MGKEEHYAVCSFTVPNQGAHGKIYRGFGRADKFTTGRADNGTTSGAPRPELGEYLRRLPARCRIALLHWRASCLRQRKHQH